jgi:hypothetical protein
MSMEPESPPENDMKTTFMLAGGAIALLAVIAAFSI